VNASVRPSVSMISVQGYLPYCQQFVNLCGNIIFCFSHKFVVSRSFADALTKCGKRQLRHVCLSAWNKSDPTDRHLTKFDI
jgi:hypothetical protein